MANSVIFWGVIFFVIMLIFGARAGLIGFRRATDEAQYASAVGSYPWYLLAFGYAANTASGITFMGVPGFAYSAGYPGLNYVLYCGPLFVVLALAAYRFKDVSTRLGAVSVVDYLGERFESQILHVLGAIGVILTFTYIAGQFVSMGWAFGGLLGVSYEWGVIIGAALVAFYVLLGGSHGTALFGALKGAIMVVIAVVIFITCYLFLFPGGVAELNARLVGQEGVVGWNSLFNPDNPLFNGPWALYSMVGPLALYAMNPNMGKYVLSLRSPQETRRFVVFSWLLVTLMTFTGFGGLGARAFFGPGQTPDQSLVNLALQVFHPAFGALVLIGLLAAIWSSSDDAVVTTGAALANDLYRRIPGVAKRYAKEELEHRAVLVNRIGVVIFVVLSVILAFTKPTYLVSLIWVGLGATMAAISPCVLLSVLWKRVTAAGCIVGILASWAVHFTLYLGGFMNQYSSTGVALIVAFAACIIVSLFTKPPRQEVIEKIFGKAAA